MKVIMNLMKQKNSLENNIQDKQIHLIDVEKQIQINKEIDLVISLKSMAYHYPFEEYFQLFKECCKKIQCLFLISALVIII